MICVLGRVDSGTGVLLNRTSGGQGPAGRTLTEETKRKISEGNKGKPSPNKGKKGLKMSVETRRKMSVAQRGGNNHFYGKTHSNETKQKISGANHYRSKVYVLTDPQGVKHKVVGTLRAFCEERDIKYSTMTWAVSMKRTEPRCNGWSIIALS